MENEIRVAYFCFLDVVGYSKHQSSEQYSIVEKVQSIFNKTITLMRLQNVDYLSISTGDGLAVCFWDKPENAVIFSLEYMRFLNIENSKLLPEFRFQIRMGIHFGPAIQVTDITGDANVLGSGINTCARVMSIAEPGQILASEIVYNLLSEHSHFSPMFQSLGSYSVKHGVIINIYNIFGTWNNQSIGNENPPSRHIATEQEIIATSGDKTAFIIMAMSSEDPLLIDVHNCILNICSNHNVKAVRVDDIEHSGKITDQIIDSIEHADIIIADLTHERPNVYYEIGLAHGQKNDVILLARKSTKLHFDLSGFNVIFYNNITELTERLEKRISATLIE